ncbi:MAG: ATP-grasp domain-containing protein [Planctomycetota bacterium]|nr:ATP-grasp domain-containing protein [Planctomycetota bacterium]MDA1177473.1 ATP-grasp domain-containing protein [Planctomycetota bacterium]
MLNPKQSLRQISRVPAAVDPRDHRPTKLTQCQTIATRERPHGRQVLLVGASVRSAAQSLQRLGWQVISADAFGDWDTRQASVCTHVASNYPDRLPQIVRRYPGIPWCYTGALENRPEWLRAWVRHAPLWGISDTTVCSVRDPWRLQDVLRQSGFQSPPLSRVAPRYSPRDHLVWLNKPRRSAGGRGIQWETESPHPLRGPRYWQRYVSGVPRGGVFVANGSTCLLLGVTGSVSEIEADPSNSNRCPESQFHYYGSWGPIPLTPAQRQWWNCLGNRLANVWGLRGVFGVDTVWTGKEFWVLEVNPRLPASAEVLDRSLGISVMEYHLSQFTKVLSDWDVESIPEAANLVAKRIVDAPTTATVPPSFVHWCAERSSGQRGLLADIPVSGTTVVRSSPLLTVFAEGHDLPALRANLQEIHRQVVDRWHRQTSD